MHTRPWVAVGILAIALFAGVGGRLAFAEEQAKPADPNMEELKIELPQESFSGTPLDYWSPILEATPKVRPAFFGPKGATVVSRGKPVTSSNKAASPEQLTKITDGNKEFPEKNVVVLKPGLQWVQIDLQKKHKIAAIVVWHFHEYDRVYKDVSVQIANDAEFTKDAKTIFNNDHDNSAGQGVGKDKEYVEKVQGRLFDAKGAEGRYIRLFSKGNTTDDTNTYIEVEVWGTAAE